jgi:hypothetical protein
MKFINSLSSLLSRIGEVQETPSQNTALRRLKSIEDKLDTLETTNNAIQAALETVRVEDSSNSTTENLGNGGIFEGDWVETLDYSSVSVEVKSDQDSATDGFQVQSSDDGLTSKHPHKHTLSAGVNHHYIYSLTGKYYRIVYTNGTTPTTDFRIRPVLNKYDISHQHTHGVEFVVDSDHPADLVRAVITAKKPDGSYINVGSTAGGNTKVSMEEMETAVETFFKYTMLSKAAFGELLTAELTPKVQLDFPYNINTDIVSTTTTGSGTVTQADGKAVLQTTAATSSSAKFESKRFLKYDPGQGALIRFTGIFTTGVANSTQIIGIGDGADGLFFGYNGTTFGVLRRQNSVDTWFAQASWSEDQGDNATTLPLMNWTTGNVFQIRYQWLGFGMITFWVENPATGSFVKVHKIEYANANTNPSIYNPSLPLMAKVENTTNNTNITLQTSSMGGFVEGREALLGPKNSISNTKTAVTTTLTNIVTIRNKTTFASKTNRVIVELDFLSYGVDGSKPAVVKVVKNATLGGSPSYNDISVNTSVVDYDIAGTTVTGGQTIFTFVVGKSDGDKLPLTGLNVDLLPGETLTQAVEATSGTTDATCGFSWIGRF